MLARNNTNFNLDKGFDSSPYTVTNQCRLLYELAKSELDVYINVDSPSTDLYAQLVSDLADALFAYLCGVDFIKEALQS